LRVNGLTARPKWHAQKGNGELEQVVQRNEADEKKRGKRESKSQLTRITPRIRKRQLGLDWFFLHPFYI